jgi:hypothetical protein
MIIIFVVRLCCLFIFILIGVKHYNTSIYTLFIFIIYLHHICNMRL